MSIDQEIKERLEKVCFCKGITLATIKESIRTGNDSLEAVVNDTGATQGACKGGRCRGKIQELIEGFKQGEWQ